MSQPSKPTTALKHVVKDAERSRRVSEAQAQQCAASSLWEQARTIPLGFSKRAGNDGLTYLPPPPEDWEFWIDNAMSLLAAIYGQDAVDRTRGSLRTSLEKRLESWRGRTDPEVRAATRSKRRAFS